MFEHIRKKLPWRAREERKKEFVKRLRGKRYVKALNVPDGAMFTICNEATAEMNCVVRASGKWLLWGTAEQISSLSDRELESYLIEQTDIVENLGKELRIVDEFGCLEWLER